MMAEQGARKEAAVRTRREERLRCDRTGEGDPHYGAIRVADLAGAALSLQQHLVSLREASRRGVRRPVPELEECQDPLRRGGPRQGGKLPPCCPPLKARRE